MRREKAEFDALLDADAEGRDIGAHDDAEVEG